LQDLFGNEPSPTHKRAPKPPLAERMRPRTWEEFRGQPHLLGPGGALRDVLSSGELTSSLLLWGPPGSGKTTLARLIASSLKADFQSFSAVTAGVREVKAVVDRAHELRKMGRGPVLLFVDEVHRFNKAQQDAFLPHIEAGTLVLVGATTENPGFAINAALRSRSRVFELQPLQTADIEALLEAAVADSERGLGGLDLELEPGVLHHLAELANGDARMALNALEFASAAARPGQRVKLDAARLRAAMAQRIPDWIGAGKSTTISFGAAQEPARQRSGCIAVLARATAGSRRRPPVRRPPSGTRRFRGRR
jgi:putative ATPase